MSQQPTHTRIIYRWPDGSEEVRYSKVYNSREALDLINQVFELQDRHGEACPYFIEHVCEPLVKPRKKNARSK